MRASGFVCAALFAALSSATLGCAFFTKSDPVVVRYFTPEGLGSPAGPSARFTAGTTSPAAVDLRIGRINSASYLRDRIAFRDESFEIGYYERLRWTEKPEAYLRRALGRALFQEQGVHQIVSGPGPTLEVDLDAFEELKSPRHAARIQVTWLLHDEQRVQFQETFTIERPIPSGDVSGSGGIAPAMAEAFEQAVQRVVGRVMLVLPRGSATDVGFAQRSHSAN
jgi:ABC-type uncharacterized transport system auxiliary subunit